jgi:hypothetical protein
MYLPVPLVRTYLSLGSICVVTPRTPSSLCVVLSALLCLVRPPRGSQLMRPRSPVHGASSELAHNTPNMRFHHQLHNVTGPSFTLESGGPATPQSRCVETLCDSTSESSCSPHTPLATLQRNKVHPGNGFSSCVLAHVWRCDTRSFP